LARHGIQCPTIAGGGTGSSEFEAASGVYTEPQCGSYIFMAPITGGTATATNRLGLGDKIRLIPGHCDPTVPPLRLVCLCARQPRRAGLADHRPRRRLLTLVA
jgi:D-serine deaminase-like pyridoxal phosphate-dependent protein